MGRGRTAYAKFQIAMFNGVLGIPVDVVGIKVTDHDTMVREL